MCLCRNHSARVLELRFMRPKDAPVLVAVNIGVNYLLGEIRLLGGQKKVRSTLSVQRPQRKRC